MADNRIFNGKMLYYKGYYDTKRDADDHAKSSRRDGYLVRITKGRAGGKVIYKVWESSYPRRKVKSKRK